MGVKFEINGEVKTIPWKECFARIWPSGRWNIIFSHLLDGEYLNLNPPMNKRIAVNAFILWKYKPYKWAVRIKKIGGLFDGIEYRPRTKR